MKILYNSKLGIPRFQEFNLDCSVCESSLVIDKHDDVSIEHKEGYNHFNITCPICGQTHNVNMWLGRTSIEYIVLKDKIKNDGIKYVSDNATR